MQPRAARGRHESRQRHDPLSCQGLSAKCRTGAPAGLSLARANKYRAATTDETPLKPKKIPLGLGPIPNNKRDKCPQQDTRRFKALLALRASWALKRLSLSISCKVVKQISKNYLARRNPILMNVNVGMNQLRNAERQLDAASAQLPPRLTRKEPDIGPAGSLLGLDE